jgi:hypothetical protein
MKIDELAEQAGRSAREAARAAQRPDIGRVQASQRRRSTLSVVVMAFVVTVISVGAVAVWPTAGKSEPEPGSVATSPTSRFTIELPGVVLGDSHVWPETPRQGTPAELATAFAIEVLEWDDPAAIPDPDADPSGPVWVNVNPRSEVVAFGHVLTVPVPEGGRVIIQVGNQFFTGGPVVGSIEGAAGTRIEVIRVQYSVGAEITIRLKDGTQIAVVEEFDENAAGIGQIDIPQIPEPSDIASILVRYVDIAGDVNAVSGGHY